MVFAFFSTGCSPYRYSTASPAKAIDAIQFFVLDEKFPEDFAWRVDLQALRQSGLEGKISRLSKDDAEKIVNGSPQSLTNPQSLHLVALYLKNDYAQALIDSTSIHLSFDQVVRTEAYEFSPGKAKSNSFWLGVLTGGPIILPVILAIACSCPSIYAENPDGVVFEGDIFAGATHPQLERHDWLPLSQLKPNDDVYRLRMLNEDPEIQHTNFLELIAVDHPVGALVGYDKYGRLLALAEPKSPIIATDPVPRMTPKARASLGASLPAGSGRCAVRFISASISASYHWLSAPAAPAATAMHRMPVKASIGCSLPGATAMAQAAVKITSVITRGFSSAK
jgi:hypothetical protein